MSIHRNIQGIPKDASRLEGAVKEFSELLTLGASRRMAFLYTSDIWDLDGPEVQEMFTRVGGV